MRYHHVFSAYPSSGIRHFFNRWGKCGGILLFAVSVSLGSAASVHAVSSTQGGDIHHEDDMVSLSRRISVGTGEFTGAFTYSYPIAVPRGRKGLQPSINLSYSSNTADHLSPFGYGWSVSIPYIERINREGVENLYNKTYFFSSLDGELASTTATQYGPKVETGDFRKYESATSTSGWTVTDKFGTIYKFGVATSTRMDDPDNAYKIFRWYLEEVRDTNDNYISYSYFKDRGQVYVATTTYTGNGSTDGPFTLEFFHESRSDVASSSEFGFWAVSGYRINEIQAKIDGSWIRKYELAYTTGDNGVHSLLSAITEAGKDEQGNITTLPAVSFTYQNTNDGWTRNAAWEGTGLPVFNNGENLGIHIADLNGDGLGDMVGYRQEDVFAKAYINKGDNTGWYDWENSPQATTSVPITADSDGNDRGTRFVDINGDGFTDILLGQGSTTAAYVNNGDTTGWTENSGWAPPYYFLDSEFKDTGLRIAELNGDGLPDLIVSNPTPLATVYINTGAGWVQDSGWSVPFEFVDYVGADKGVRVLDINGDGLADLIRASSNDGESDSVYFNTGKKGWAEHPSWTVPEVFIESGGEAYGVRLVDVNGDNLVDIVRSDNQPGPGTVTKIYLNRGDGTGWTQDSNWSIPFQFIDSNGVDQGVRIEDVNGDGLADLIQSILDQERVYLHNGKKADLLTKITHNEGGRTVTSYKPAQQYISGTTPLNPHLPFVVYTAETTEHHDGISATTSRMTYEYRGGDFYYGFVRDRKFAGFGTTTVTNAAGHVTKTFFHQGNDSDSTKGEYADDSSKIAKPYRMEVYDASSNLYAKTINKWDNYDLGYKRDFVKLIQKADFSYDGDADHADKSEEYTYSDSTGNLTQKIEWGAVTGSDDGTFADTGTDKFITDITYAASSTPYILGLPSQEITKDSSTTTVKDMKFYYDSLANGSVDVGNETKREFWKTGSTYIDTEKTYNSYGLVTSQKDPRDKTTTYTYDALNLYVATSTNPLAHVTSYAYDYSNGKPKRVTNPNGFIFETVFDGLDRVTGEKQPDLTTPTTRITKTAYTYTDSQPRTVQETHNLDGSNSFLVYKYFDGLGRIVQERKEAEDSLYVVRDFEYNNRGQLNKDSLPYFSSGIASTTATSTSSLFTNYAYDALERPSTIANAVGTTVHTYDDWQTTSTDTESSAKDFTRDAYSRLTEIVEHEGNNAATTTYEYNYLGNLTKITDAAANVRNFTYDGLGRRLTAQDLHDTGDATYGTWSYTFDDAGNLSTQTDPDNREVDFTYDDVNRVLTEDYTGKSGTEIEYTYDSCSNGTGFLCSATTTDAVSNHAYNALGGTSTSTIAIDSTDYATGYDYDRQANQTYIVYPDNSKVAYTYNTAGLLEMVSRKEKADTSYSSVVTDFDYSPAEQSTLQVYYNGAQTTREYDHTELYRLKHLLTEFPGVGGAGLLEDPGYFIEDLNQSTAFSDNRTGIGTTTADSGSDAATPVTENPASVENPSSTDIPLVEDSIPDIAASSTPDSALPENPTATATTTLTVATPLAETTANEEATSTLAVDVLAENTDINVATTPEEPIPAMGGRAFADTAEKLVVTSTNADVLERMGITAVPENNKIYENIVLPADIQDQLQTRSWNRITYPLEATIVKRTIANTPDVVAEVIPIKFESEFHGKWINYLSTDGWKSIDTSIATSSNGTLFEMRNAPFEAEFPLRSSGIATITNTNRWDVFNGKEITAPPLAMTITAVGVADVPGRITTGDLYVPSGLRQSMTYVLYENAYPEGDLIYYVDHARAPRLEKLVRINRTPTQLEYAFDITISGAHTAAKDTDKKSIRIEAAKDRGFGFKPFRLWDSSLKGFAGDDTIQEIDVAWEVTGENSYRLTKILPPSFFDTNPVYPVYTDTTSTFYPDPDAESTSVDGYVWRDAVDQVWADIHDATAGTFVFDNGSALNVNLSTNATSGHWDRMGRGFALFDTSSIPDGDVVSSAILSLDGDGGTDNFNQSGCLVGSTPASNTGISTADYDQLGTTLYATCLDLGSWTTTAYNDLSLNSTGIAAISITGISKFGWRLSSDRENSAPTWVSDTSADASPHSADVAGTSVDPKLVVVHAAANQAPTAPTLLFTEGLTNPTNISDPSPEFSAIYNDPNAGDQAPWYRIQVSTSSLGEWAHALWDSGTSTMATTTESNRSPDITYAGSALASSTTYYWRIRFSDDDRKEGAWSTATSTFKLSENSPSPSSTGGMQNLTYSYDNVGNITEIIDVSDTDTYKTVTYVYDNLHRLKSATSTLATSTQSNYTQTYSYDSIGNITSKSDVGTYTYGETNYANPHAATDINGATQTYSNSGNLLGNGTWNFRWDYRGQLVKATTTSAVTNFGYDHTGARVFLKEGTTATTTYANKFYSVSSATTTKHIFANGQLVATIEGNGVGVGGAGLNEDTGFFIEFPGFNTKVSEEIIPLPQETQQALETRSWNSITVPIEGSVPKGGSYSPAEVKPTKLQTEFKTKWVSYLGADDKWHKINTDFIDKGTRFEVSEAPFKVQAPKTAASTATFTSNNRWDIFEDAKITDAPFTQSIRAVGVADVPGVIETGDFGYGTVQYVVYKDAYPFGDLIYWVWNGRAPRLKKIVRFTSVPPTDLSLEFEMTYSEDPDIKITKETLTPEEQTEYEWLLSQARAFEKEPDGHFLSNHTELKAKDILRKLWDKKQKITTKNGISQRSPSASGRRGIGLKDFTFWYVSNLSAEEAGGIHQTPIEITYEKVGDTYKLEKHIPLSLFDGATLPAYTDTESTFYPDPDTESTSVDGYVWRDAVDETWAAIHDAAAGTFAFDAGSATNMQIKTSSTSNQWQRMGRAFFLFDTSALPDTDTVTAATLSLSGADDIDNFSQSIDIVTSTPASNTALGTADYDQLGTVLQATSMTVATWVVGTVNDDNVFTFNATGRGNISKTGISKFGNRMSADTANSPPTWASVTAAQAAAETADVVGTTRDPKLVVTHIPVNNAPTAPTSLQTEGLTNPIDIIDPTPEFSAVYNDPDSGDLAPYYRMQVSTSSAGEWAHAYWDTGTSTMATTTAGNRSPDITYAGSALASSTTYYWRIRFSDDDRKEGAWSTATSTFSLSESETGGTPPELCNCATSTIYYIHTDHLSGSNAITNSAGERTQVVDYYPYGSIRVNKLFGDFDEKKKFTGYEQDYSTGLNYAGARYQNPDQGRFVSQDPTSRDNPEQFVADPQQLNSYNYARNNPLRYNDPNGEQAVPVEVIKTLITVLQQTIRLLIAYTALQIASSPEVQNAASQAVQSASNSFSGGYSAPANSSGYIGTQTAVSTPSTFYGTPYASPNYSDSLDFSKSGGAQGTPKPNNAPAGTKPIDQTGLPREVIHEVKNPRTGIGAGPRDWVGVSPKGDVITGTPDGRVINHGPIDGYTGRPTGLVK